ncbi:MAG: 3-phosphoshikimate 1-carboxyvinyltransferase [Chloroflexi bacterium]|nr:3-phosphoshikimate 1-carboxyvinyltransferase [Chloroflexota bacterium]
MTYKVTPASALEGEIEPPGDKSISHRAVIFNSIAHGRASISNYLEGADTLATVRCLEALGVDIRIEGGQAAGAGGRQSPLLTVTGCGIEGLAEAAGSLDARNSGTTMRLLAGLLSAAPFFTVISGDASLSSRPMGRVIEPLRLMGADIRGRDRDGFAPLAIRGGGLKGIEYHMPVASAQVKSAILLAGLFAEGTTTLHQPAPSRDHTERLFRAMGAALTTTENTITLDPGPLTCLDVQVPGDISSAAPWLVAGSLHPEARITIRGVGVNPTRTGIIDVLRAMGAQLVIGEPRESGGEPVADITVESSRLEGVEICGDLVPRLIDEIPLIALAATQATGTTVISDAQELRIKESDRIQTTVQELRRLGADVEERPDGMIIRGPTPLRGATCDSHGDHRLAMALGIAGLVTRGETIVSDPGVVDVSYPGFWKDLERLKAG